MAGQRNRASSRDFAVQVVRQLRRAGFQAVWAGGCVRDELLGHQPKDYDVATDARPEQVRQVFGPRRTRDVGVVFGVVTVRGPRGTQPIEVATFRRDDLYQDGRHPDRVVFSSPEEDARRRDFTINGLFYDPIQREVLDFVGGRADLHSGVIRAIGDPDQRLDEDKLRMLRAVRFAADLGFHIEPLTFQAIQRHAAEIQVVSPERIAMELRRVLVHPSRATAWRMLHDTRLLSYLIPETQQLETAPGVSDAVTEKTCELLARLKTDQFPTALAVAMWPLSEPMHTSATELAEATARRWKLSNDERQQTAWIIERIPIARRARAIPWPQLQRVLVDVRSSELVAAAAAISEIENQGQESIEFCRQRLAWPSDQLDPPRLVTGHDLMAEGIPAGPKLGALLEAIRDAQLEGRIHTPDEAIQWAREHWPTL